MIDIVEVGEVGIYLHDPVRNAEDDSANEEPAPPFREKWFELHPSDDIVQYPRSIEEDGGDRKPPGVDRLIEENHEALPVAHHQL